VAALAALVVFPPFALVFWWFYAHVCAGDLRVLSPVLWGEGLTPWAGGLQKLPGVAVPRHAGGFWPDGVQLPPELDGVGRVGVARLRRGAERAAGGRRGCSRWRWRRRCFTAGT
jgi:hypothetical protein